MTMYLILLIDLRELGKMRMERERRVNQYITFTHIQSQLCPNLASQPGKGI